MSRTADTLPLMRLSPLSTFLKVLVAGLGCWTTCALIGCGEDEVGRSTAITAGQSAVEVRVTSAVRQEIPRYIRVTGTLFGDEETTVAAKVAGRIVEIHKDLGDVAQLGDPLLRIDPTDYELALAERQSAFEEALSRLGLTELPAENFNVDALPAVERARHQEANARAKFERARSLNQQDPPVVSEQDLADLQTGWEVAQSNFKVEKLEAQATLAEARTLLAQVHIAEQRVRDAEHRAPAVPVGDTSGASSQNPQSYEVAWRMVAVGDYVQVGDPLMRLVDADPLKLRVSIPERRLQEVKLGQQVTAHIEAFSQPFKGAVSRISPTVDRETRAFTVEISISNPDRALKPGSFASAEIEIGREAALLVPATSIVNFAGVQKVVIISEGKAKELIIQVGDRHGENIEVRSGLTGSEEIVDRPAGSLVTGTPVRVANGAAGDQAVAENQNVENAPAR